jgi:hypothetical protein
MHACFFKRKCTEELRPAETNGLDHSVMDMSYWPINYPYLKLSGKAKAMPVARIIYSRPLKEGRTIFGKNSATVWSGMAFGR